MMHMAHLTVHTYIGIGSHTALYPPSVVPAMAPHLSMDTLLGLTIKAKYSPTVIGPFGFQFIGQGNDSGFIVPHIALPPPSVLVPLVILFGGSKPMFSASTVKIDIGGATSMACNVIPFAPVGINQACNDPCNYPSDIVICPNTVVVGMTLGDLISGLAATAFDSLFSFIASKIGGAIGSALSKRIIGLVFRETAEQIAREIGEEASEQILKDIVENVAERAIWQAASTLVEKLFGVLVDPLGSEADSRIREAINGGPASDAAAASANSMSGSDGSDPRVHDAA